ncbi:hypothetical protein ACH5RR_031895 [Cinchona calisaya]|uniref:Uncharacterized protein n=1 Tax=Cinchona calisaya TaxID=153742 RepID=A0ABD2YHM1_9GENT
MAKPHILIVYYPAHGHINPSLQFSRRLLKIGIEVTFATSKFAHPPVGEVLDTSNSFNFAATSEGYGEDFKPEGFEVNHLKALKTYGPGTLRLFYGFNRPQFLAYTTIILTDMKMKSRIVVMIRPGCFVTHCGWNTLESIIFGVPVIAFPQWTDQGTNAKLLQDVWGRGVRVVPNEDGIVGSNEIKRCIELVTDSAENGLEVGGNGEKWRDLALERKGGSLDKILKHLF